MDKKLIITVSEDTFDFLNKKAKRNEETVNEYISELIWRARVLQAECDRTAEHAFQTEDEFYNRDKSHLL